MTNKKTFVIQIDGIEKAYNDLTLLSETLDKIDTQIAKPKTLNLIASAFKDASNVVSAFGKNVDDLMIAVKNIETLISSVNTAQKQSKDTAKEEKKEEKPKDPIKKPDTETITPININDFVERSEIVSDIYKQQLLDEENFRKLLEKPFDLHKQLDALNTLKQKLKEINDQTNIYGDNAKYTEEASKTYQNYYKLLEILYQNDAEKLKAATDAKNTYNKEFAENSKKMQEAIDKTQLVVGDAKDASKGHELLKELKHLEDLKKDANAADLIIQKAHIKQEEKLQTERNTRITELEKSAVEKNKEDKKNRFGLDIQAIKANLDTIKELRKKNTEEIKAEAQRVAQIYDDMAANFEKDSEGEVAILKEKKIKLAAINEEIKANDAAVKDTYKAFNEAYKKEVDSFGTSITTSIDARNTKIAELEKIAIEKSYSGFMRLNALKRKETKANLDAIKELRQQNIINAKAEVESVSKAYDEMAANFEKGSKQETEILEAKQKTLHKINTQIIADEAAVKDARKAYNEAYQKYYEEIGEKITTTFNKYNEMYTQVGSVFKGMLEMNLEDLQVELTETQKNLEAKTKAYTDHKSKVESLEKEAATASGGRAVVLQEQLAREMAARDEALQQQKEQEKEKEEIEKKIARKKKQQAKIDKVQEIAKATADQSAAIIKAWGAGPILGPIMAGITAAATAIQLAKLIKSWDKLEDGGLLSGKRHAQGGMRIEGTNIEVEGDEYVVNRISTRKNLGLIDYINRNRKELTPQDLDNYFVKSGKSPQASPTLATQQMYEEGGRLTNLDVINTAVAPDNDKILEAIAQINFKPVVSVVDIANVQQNITEVKDIAGL